MPPSDGSIMNPTVSRKRPMPRYTMLSRRAGNGSQPWRLNCPRAKAAGSVRSAAQRFRRILYTAANAVLRLRKKRRKAKTWMLLRKNRRLLRKKQSARPAFLRRKKTHLFRRKSIKHNQKE